MWIGRVKNPRSMEANKKIKKAGTPSQSVIHFQLLINSLTIMPAYAPMLEGTYYA